MSNEWSEVARGVFFILWLAGVPALMIFSIILGGADLKGQEGGGE